MEFLEEILALLKANGLHPVLEKTGSFEVITVSTRSGTERCAILPVDISAGSIDAARQQQEELAGVCEEIVAGSGVRPILIAADRWFGMKELMQARLLSHIDIFFPIYARNCEIRRIDKDTAANFLRSAHSYGDAACRHRYGLFLKRHTGKTASSSDSHGYPPGTLVAVATFSNARKWKKSGREIRSYEWVRYASLPEVRVAGGMGKLLKAFIEDVRPDDIMSYADLEWSEGNVYERLGFALEGIKEPVTFSIDTGSWKRTAIRDQEISATRGAMKKGHTYFRNFGSNKYRLKLTDYQ